jgi:hypothetical protein
MAPLYILLISIATALLFLFLSSSVPKSLLTSLDNAGIVLGYSVTSLTAGIGIYAYLKRRYIKQWFRRTEFHSAGQPFDVPAEKVDAVVIPVSRREQPEWILRFLKPRQVALLYTQVSRETTIDLLQDFQTACQFSPNVLGIRQGEHMIRNPDDPVETKKIAKFFINRFKETFPADRIFVDTTGGKVPMSIGAFQAAEEENVSSIYIVGTVWDSRSGLIVRDPKERSHGRPIFISDKTAP